MSAPMLFVWILELDCAVNRLFMFLSLSHVLDGWEMATVTQLQTTLPGKRAQINQELLAKN